jgi:SAM-dependent methyltransferase
MSCLDNLSSACRSPIILSVPRRGSKLSLAARDIGVRAKHDEPVDVFKANQSAWDRAAEQGNPYAQSVSAEEVADARQGCWRIHLSDTKPVPREWLGNVAGLRILCLAGGGGQQGPILAAAGAQVVVVDASTGQLAQDRAVAERDGLDITTVQSDMADLSGFGDEEFDMIVNPVSTLFVPELAPVWRECHRTLRPGGTLLTGFLNPDEFVFDPEALDERGEFIVRYPLPHVEHESLTEAEAAARQEAGEMFHFSHTMEDQLGGMLGAGFTITGFYEDRRSEADGNPIRHYMPSIFVVRAERRR